MDDCVDLLPEDKPRYLYGVGTPDYLFGKVLSEESTRSDCVLPTRLARYGMAMTSRGKINIKNAADGKGFQNF